MAFHKVPRSILFEMLTERDRAAFINTSTELKDSSLKYMYTDDYDDSSRFAMFYNERDPYLITTKLPEYLYKTNQLQNLAAYARYVLDAIYNGNKAAVRYLSKLNRRKFIKVVSTTTCCCLLADEHAINFTAWLIKFSNKKYKVPVKMVATALATSNLALLKWLIPRVYIPDGALHNNNVKYEGRCVVSMCNLKCLNALKHTGILDALCLRCFQTMIMTDDISRIRWMYNYNKNLLSDKFTALYINDFVRTNTGLILVRGQRIILWAFMRGMLIGIQIINYLVCEDALKAFDTAILNKLKTYKYAKVKHSHMPSNIFVKMQKYLADF